MAAENGFIAGAGWACVAFRDAQGYPSGVLDTLNGVAFANGTTTSAYRIKHPVQYTPSAVTRERVIRQGGLSFRGARDMGVSDFGEAQLTLDAYDEQLQAYLTRTAVDTATMSGWTMTAFNDQLSQLPQMILLVMLGITTEDGADDWLTIVHNNVVLRPAKFGAGQDSGTNPNLLTLDVVVNTSQRTGIGRLYSGTALDVVDDSDTALIIRYQDPIGILTTYKDDASGTSVTLPFLPTSSDNTGGATNSITRNGATDGVTSVSTSTGGVVLVAETAADKWVFACPTRFRAA